MPKRMLKQHSVKAAKVHRKSIGDPPQLLVNSEDEENKNEDCSQNTTKRMRYIPTNQNNEVERLLMHNSKMLIYHVDHSDFPSFNVGMWPQENCDMLTNYPTCGFSSPRPLYVADKQCEKIDICYKRPMNRHFFQTRMKKTKSAYQTALKCNKNIRRCIKDNIYHYSIFEMAERVLLQPDPFFQSSYDYYFTGGNLGVLPIGQVIHAGGEKLKETLVSKIPDASEHTDTNSLLNIASLKNSEDCEIFEYHPLITTMDSSRQNCFIARQRNLITFNYLNEMNQLKIVTQFRTKSTPFISFAQSNHNINNFIITTMKQHVRLYDLGGSAPALINLFEISPNARNISWNTVKPWRENTFMYANEKQFCMIDIRTTPEQWLKEASFPNSDLTCEHISAVLPSDFKNLFYVATNHKLQCMDIRYLKKNSLSDAVGGISRWTHQLRYAPLMMDTFRLRQTEYIALSSPIAGDLHICQLSRERNDDNICLDSSVPAPKHIYSSPCLPYQPPTLLEAYEHARFSGKCLRIEADLPARIKCCTTGMKFFKSDSNSGIGLLLFSNSNGDIFGHTLSKREKKETEERCNQQSDGVMAEFEQKICNLVQQPLNYTEIKDMKGVRKVLLCQTLSSVKKFDFDEMDNEYNGEATAANNTTNTPGISKRKRFYLGRWQKSLSTLHSYKDALAADLLSIWDLDVEEENKVHLGNLRLAIKTDPVVKVENWLHENINPDPPMLSIPSAKIRHSDNNNTSKVINTSLNLTQTQNTVDFKSAVHSTQILHDSISIANNFDASGIVVEANGGDNITAVDKLKNKKKTKKYVKGF